jgi:hypothetical protein
MDLLEEKLGRRDLIKAWREGEIPKEGQLGDGISYKLHGVGCFVEFPDYDVDFDFAGEAEVGFDAWRVWSHVQQFPQRYPQYPTRAAIEKLMDECLAAGVIEPVEPGLASQTNPELFRLTSSYS